MLRRASCDAAAERADGHWPASRSLHEAREARVALRRCQHTDGQHLVRVRRRARARARARARVRVRARARVRVAVRVRVRVRVGISPVHRAACWRRCYTSGRQAARRRCRTPRAPFRRLSAERSAGSTGTPAAAPSRRRIGTGRTACMRSYTPPGSRRRTRCRRAHGRSRWACCRTADRRGGPLRSCQLRHQTSCALRVGPQMLVGAELRRMQAARAGVGELN